MKQYDNRIVRWQIWLTPFFVPPPDRLKIPRSQVAKLERELGSSIQDFNARLVAATDQEMKSIQSIVLVAGSQLKGAALRKLLSDKYPIRFLCVDVQFAQELVPTDAYRATGP